MAKVYSSSNVTESTHSIISHITALEKKFESYAKQNIGEMQAIRNEIKASEHALAEIAQMIGNISGCNCKEKKLDFVMNPIRSNLDHRFPHLCGIKAHLSHDRCLQNMKVLRWRTASRGCQKLPEIVHTGCQKMPEIANIPSNSISINVPENNASAFEPLSQGPSVELGKEIYCSTEKRPCLVEIDESALESTFRMSQSTGAEETGGGALAPASHPNYLSCRSPQLASVDADEDKKTSSLRPHRRAKKLLFRGSYADIFRTPSLKRSYADIFRTPSLKRGSIVEEVGEFGVGDKNDLGIRIRSDFSANGRGGPIRRMARQVFGICEADAVQGLPGSRVVDPASPFSAGMEVVSGALLLYSLAVIPLQLSLWEGQQDSSDKCVHSPTLEFDMFADLFFLVEILLNFAIGIVVGGNYCDDLRIIAVSYVTTATGFWFDAVTSIPFAWIDWWVLQRCAAEPARSASGWSQNLYIARAVKPLKILKMARLLKLFKHVHAVSHRLNISPAQERVVQLLLALLAFMHAFSCAYWRLKIELNSDADVRLFLQSKDVDPNSLADIYVLCMYFVCTVLTTTGFGDISADAFAERIFLIFLMACASMLFGLILGEMQEIFAVSNARSRDRDERIDAVHSFLRESDIPPAIVRRVSNWIRFEYLDHKADQKRQDVMETLPAEIREELAGAINSGLFSKIPIFARIPSDPTLHNNLKARFTSALIRSMSSAYFLQDSLVTSYTDVADRIMIICSGSVAMYLPNQATPLLTLRPRDSFGDNSVLGDPRWAGMYGIDADFVARENCKIVYVTAQAVLDIVQDKSFVRIRRLLERLVFQGEEAGDVMDMVSVRNARTTFAWIRLARQMLRRTVTSSDIWAHSVAQLWSQAAGSFTW